MAPLFSSPIQQKKKRRNDTQKEHATRGTMNPILPIAKWIIIRSCYLLLMCIFKWSLFVYTVYVLTIWRSVFGQPFIHSSDESFLWLLERLKSTSTCDTWLFEHHRNWMCRDDDIQAISHLRFCLLTCVLAFIMIVLFMFA